MGLLQPLVDLPLGLVFRNAVTLLQLAGKLSPFALHDIKIVVGQFTPLLLQIALKLLPV